MNRQDAIWFAAVAIQRLAAEKDDEAKKSLELALEAFTYD